MTELDLQDLKRKIAKRISSGHKIRFKWDAGGDQTICYFEEGDGDFLKKEYAASLNERVIVELNLPGAGEHYHEGGGEIFMTAEGAVAIRFSGNEFTYSWDEKDLPDSREATVLAEDRGKLRRFLSRSQIMLNLIYDWQGKWEISLNTRIEEGDAPYLNEEAKQYYESILHPIAAPYLKRFGPKEEYILGGRIELIMEIKETDESPVDVCPEFQIIHLHQNKEVILIP